MSKKEVITLDNCRDVFSLFMVRRYPISYRAELRRKPIPIAVMRREPNPIGELRRELLSIGELTRELN